MGKKISLKEPELFDIEELEKVTVFEGWEEYKFDENEEGCLYLSPFYRLMDRNKKGYSFLTIMRRKNHKHEKGAYVLVTGDLRFYFKTKEGVLNEIKNSCYGRRGIVNTLKMGVVELERSHEKIRESVKMMEVKIGMFKSFLGGITKELEEDKKK